MTEAQWSLFDEETCVGDFSDVRLDPVERPRLNNQCIEILRLMCLSAGNVSNTQLTGIALRYSARIFDLKSAGIVIKIATRNRETGQNWYAFASPEDRQRAQRYL